MSENVREFLFLVRMYIYCCSKQDKLRSTVTTKESGKKSIQFIPLFKIIDLLEVTIPLVIVLVVTHYIIDLSMSNELI